MGAGIAFRVTVHDEETRAGFAALRAEAESDIERVTLAAAESEILPLTRSLAAPSRSRSTIVAQATAGGVAVLSTAKGLEQRIVSLLNAGGTVTTTILPHRAQALALPGGIIRASVRGPRTYRAKRFMEKSVDDRLPAFVERVEAELTRLVEERVG